MRPAHKALLLLGWMTVAVSAAFAQAGVPAASKDYVPTLTFDVASIRQSPASDSVMVAGYFAPHSSSFRVTNWDAMNLLANAYGVRRDQIVGLPDWATGGHAMFNIQAKSDSAADERLAHLSLEQQRLEQQHMMQVLLADRFQLKVHWETRQGPAYNLVVAKNGLKMNTAKGEPPSPAELKMWGDQPIPSLYQKGDSRTGFDFIAHGCSMEDIAGMLAGQFGQPVADKTSLTGKFDFILRYHGARLSDRSADDPDPVPTLDAAIQEQLGLKLEPTKAPTPFLVIDHIERPSEN